MERRYTMSEGMAVAKQATLDIERWLRGRDETTAVRNVEDELIYQKMDVDLLWETSGIARKIEIKGDRYHMTGNFFFETHSNEERGKPGCFMYTEADELFYYFTVPRHLYRLPMPATRDWFTPIIGRFRERRTTTPAGSGYYTTVGRLVPIQIVLREVSGVVLEQLPKG
jgi:hypothetical protein